MSQQQAPPAAGGGPAAPFTAAQQAEIASMLQAALQAAGQAPAPQTGVCPATEQESQRLSDVKRLLPNEMQRLFMPGFTLQQLPDDPKELYGGNIPLPPVADMAVSLPLKKTLQDLPSGNTRPGSLKYEAAFLVSSLSILDLMDRWISDYTSLLSRVLADRAQHSELLTGPLTGLGFLHHWLAAIAAGRLACIETFLGDGGRPALESLDSRYFGSSTRFTFTTPATLQHTAALDAAVLKEQVKLAAMRKVHGSSSGSGSGGAGSSNTSSGRGRARGGRGGGRTAGYGGRGSSSGNDGSSTGAGADRT